MRKLKVVAIIVAAVLMLTGCAMFTRNETRAANQVVATVNGTQVHRYQVEKYFHIAYFEVNQTPVDTLASASKSDYRTQLSAAVETYAKQLVLIQKARQLGLSLSEDDKASNRKSADEAFGSVKESIKASVEDEAKTNTSLNVDAETEERYQAELKTLGFNADDYFDYLNDQTLITKVEEYAKQFAQVTDEDAKSWYDQMLAEQQKKMDADPSVFATNVYSSHICTYIPEDTVAVKQVLLAYKDKDLSEVAQQLYNDGKTEEAMAILKPQIDELTPEAESIARQLKDGANIDDLIKQYGEDPGMTSGTTAKTGYLVGNSTKNFLQQFKDEALKLKNVGDVSQPLATYYGIHVLQAIKIYKKGVVAYDEIKDQIKTALLPSKQAEKVAELEEQWYKEANITYDKERLFN